MKKNLLFAFLIISSVKLNACECSKLLWAENTTDDIVNSISTNELIFLGELIESSNLYYQIKVSNVFKGDINIEDVVKGSIKSGCSGTSDNKRKGLWIFYGNYYYDNHENVVFSYSSCGLTRSLYNPFLKPQENMISWDIELDILNNKCFKSICIEL